MSQSVIFEQAMDFIDERILSITNYTEDEEEEIIDALYEKFKHSNIRFTSFITALTNGQMTLDTYITSRKLYFATLEIRNTNTKIIDIAMKYYAHHSGLDRAIKIAYGFTPTEIRKNKPSIPDNRLCLSDLVDQSDILSRIISKVDALNRPIGDYESDLFITYTHAMEDYGFDTETICLIADLAQRLDLSFAYLLKKVFEADINAGKEFGDCMPVSEVALALGINSSDDAYAITEYYHVQSVYDLDQDMVDEYYAKMK